MWPHDILRSKKFQFIMFLTGRPVLRIIKTKNMKNKIYNKYPFGLNSLADHTPDPAGGWPIWKLLTTAWSVIARATNDRSATFELDINERKRRLAAIFWIFMKEEIWRRTHKSPPLYRLFGMRADYSMIEDQHSRKICLPEVPVSCLADYVGSHSRWEAEIYWTISNIFSSAM